MAKEACSYRGTGIPEECQLTVVLNTPLSKEAYHMAKETYTQKRDLQIYWHT